MMGEWQRLPRPVRRGPGPGFQALAPVVAGDRVVVVAGVDYDQATVKAIVFDPDSRSWSRAAPSGIWWRFGYTAVAAGDQVLVWGGCCGHGGRGSRAAGVIYDVTQDRWLPLEPGPLGDHGGHTAVWTGEEMLVWGGGGRGGLRADGAAYNPASESWSVIPPAPLTPRYQHAVVWTGEEMIVWGGSRPLRPLRAYRERPLYDGAAYDPRSDTWRRLAPTRLLAPLPGVLDVLEENEELDLNAVWTGDTMLIWGPNGGASYDPDSDQWERIPTPPPDFGVSPDGSTRVWTGDEVIVWGGLRPFTGDKFVATGAAYDPQQKRWRQLPQAPISGRYQHAAVWTGDGMLVWGGLGHRAYLVDGAIYTP